jgi:GT2 family glycosyltransferase
LEALNEQTLSKELFEILVVNNDPLNAKPDWLELPENGKILLQKRPGSYSARNLGMLSSCFDIIAFTDSDCIPDKFWLERGLAHIQNGYDLVGGQVEFFKEDGGDDLTFLFEKTFNFNQKKNVEERGQSITANLFIKKEVITDIGLFSENLMSGGDFEWTQKATSKGFQIKYGADTKVFHPARRRFRDLISKKKRTSGGMFYRFFEEYSVWEKLSFTLNMLRPRISLLFRKDLMMWDKLKLFVAVWYLEWIGIKEMFLMAHKGKSAQRH